MSERLLDEFQRDFPLVERPFAAIASRLTTRQDAVLRKLCAWTADGTISRIGPVFRPGSFGASTLAAIAVPEQRLAAVAALVSTHPEVNHNYEREHRFNLWFVVTAADEQRVARVLAAIERETGLAVNSLPLLNEYHIDLGFPLHATGGRPRGENIPGEVEPLVLDAPARALVAALQDGLPLVSRPFAAVAERAGWHGARREREVIDRIRSWIDCGAIKRFGVVVRHRALGYVANAMCAWDVAMPEADTLGRALAREGAVTLCYRRARAGSAWPYNLYCMIHGRDREAVEADLAALSLRHGLDAYPRAVLFSRRAFKQRGARYVEPAEVAHG
jgi:DNA-binding Lrp family transcriptional regulator